MDNIVHYYSHTKLNQMARMITIDEDYIYEYRTYFLNEPGGNSEQVSSRLETKLEEYGVDGWKFHSSIMLSATQYHLIFERKTNEKPEISLDKSGFID